MSVDALPNRPVMGDRPQRQVRRRWLFAAPVLFVAFVGGGTAALVRDREDKAAQAAGGSSLDLGSVSDGIAVHYGYAETHQAEFAAIACFCGCEEFLAHRHLYDCFVRADGTGYDRHAAGCGVCIAEATVAARLLDQGAPIAAVAQHVVEQFGSTPTTVPDQTAALRS